jgi:transcriptional regulator with XRE-family HTH domain
MEKGINYWHAMSDPALLEIIGKFIQQTRLQQNKTQQQVATAAGVNRSTLVQIENGGSVTMLSLVQILRALGQLQLFQRQNYRRELSNSFERTFKINVC